MAGTSLVVAAAGGVAAAVTAAGRRQHLALFGESEKVLLLADGVGFPNPAVEFVVENGGITDTDEVDDGVRSVLFDFAEARTFDTAGEPEMDEQIRLARHGGDEAHTVLEDDTGFLWDDDDTAAGFDQVFKVLIEGEDVRFGANKGRLQVEDAAGVPHVGRSQFCAAPGTLPERWERI
jgi:hypothetical protein